MAASNILHGTWAADNTITVLSDQRLKKNVQPLYESLAEIRHRYGSFHFFAPFVTWIWKRDSIVLY